jgi:4,5-dihydroxyphthalate decarboxylase
MTKISLSLAIWPNPRINPLLDGVVQPEAIDLVISRLPGPDVFWRQLRFAEFDVSEMSLSSLLMATAKGDRRFKALPIFPDRRFFHSYIMVRTSAGIESPADIRGKRVGVPDYQMTAALWSRGALQHEFGVSPMDLDWYMERTADWSHAAATGFTPPSGLRLQHMRSDKSITGMMIAGELDVALVYIPKLLVGGTTMIDRSKAPLPPEAAKPLFADREAETARYFGRMGFIPMNHCVVVKTEVLERHPWVSVNLQQAFTLAKDRARQDTWDALVPQRETGVLPPATAVNVQNDLFPYGFRANEKALNTLADYSFEQGLTPRRMRIEEIFAESVMGL